MEGLADAIAFTLHPLASLDRVSPDLTVYVVPSQLPARRSLPAVSTVYGVSKQAKLSLAWRLR